MNQKYKKHNKLNQRELQTEILNGIFRYDEKAWERFIDEYSGIIRYSIYRTAIIKGMEISKDKVYDLFIDFLVTLIEKDFRKLKAYDGRDNASLVTFLCVCASNYTINCINKEKKRPFSALFSNMSEEFTENIRDTRPDSEDSIYEKEKEKEKIKLINEYRGTLNPTEKEIFDYILAGKTPKEIGNILNHIPISTVYRKIKKIKDGFIDFCNKKKH